MVHRTDRPSLPGGAALQGGHRRPGGPHARHGTPLFPWQHHQAAPGQVPAVVESEGGGPVHVQGDQGLLLVQVVRNLRHDSVVPERNSLLIVFYLVNFIAVTFFLV